MGMGLDAAYRGRTVMTRPQMHDAVQIASQKLEANGLLLFTGTVYECLYHFKPIAECKASCSVKTRLVAIARGESSC